MPKKTSKNKKETFIVVHLVSDETGEKICDVPLSEEETLKLVEYAIKDIFKKATEKKDVL